MGYFNKVEPEAAPRAISCASPKTHVPVSPVKERGHRYFMPETGRWVNRDPAAVGGCSEQSCPSTSLFIAESIFTRDEPIGHVDILGLACAKCPSALTSRIRSGGECGHEYRTKISKGPPSAPNGCGAQGGIFIPDSFFGVVSFTDCCNGHDNCYGKCGKSKTGCDATLSNCMRGACHTLWFLPPVYAICLAQAASYGIALTPAGWPAYEAGQDENCIWEGCCK